jgi:hypothetical protein
MSGRQIPRRSHDGTHTLINLRAFCDEVASYAELEAIVKGYSKMAGFDQTQVNRSEASQSVTGRGDR